MNLIDNEEKIFCPLCTDKKPMKQITHKHLKKHNLSTQQFKDEYPSYYLTHPKIQARMIQARLEGKRKKDKLIVEKPCWNHDICKHTIFVNNNVPNQNVTCDECKSKGLFHPNVKKQKERLSKQAKKMNKDKTIIDKRTETLKNRSAEEIESWKNKREKTLEGKDGPDWKQKGYEKTKAGMLKTYGKEHALQVPEILDQAQMTYFINTEGKHINPMNDPTNVKKVFDQRNQEEINKTTLETNIKRYNGPSPMCAPEVIEKSNITRFLNQQDRILKYLDEIGFVLLSAYEHAHEKAIFKHISCGYEWETNWNNLWNNSKIGNPCPNCKPKNTNTKTAQNNVQKFIESLGFNPLVDNRVFLGDRRELDFIIEEEKVCIEYCGLYWHSHEMLKDTRKKINDPTTYHLTKLQICEKKGYRLITIFEDEWIEKKEITQARLKQILNKSTSERVHARQCKIHEITSKAKIQFLNAFHIQGSNDGSRLSYGAFDKNDNLIAIMTFGKPRAMRNAENTEWEIKRFCSDFNFHAAGIANKLLSHFKNNNEWSYIVSYADRRWSNGNLYENLGFALENTGTPAAWFVDVNKVKRHHRTIMWAIKKNDTLGLTQEQLAVVNGFRTIYDCGSLKYTIQK